MPSLQDQLLQSGLIDAKKAKQAQKEKRKENNQARRAAEPVVDEVKQQVELTRAEKANRDRELNRQREHDIQQRAIAAQIKQLIENHRQAKLIGGEELVFNFTHGKHIKKIRVSAKIHQLLTHGQLAIVVLGDNYELIPRIIADKIAQRDASVVVFLNRKTELQQDEEDPYKDYTIPDDLMW